MNETRWDDGMAQGYIYEGKYQCCSCFACAIISVAITYFFSRIDTGFVEERSGYMTAVFRKRFLCGSGDVKTISSDF